MDRCRSGFDPIFHLHIQEDEVIHNNNVIGYLDFVAGKANYALSEDMVVANLSDKQEIHLYDAKHPLIDRNKVIGNEYHLDEEKRIVVDRYKNKKDDEPHLKPFPYIMEVPNYNGDYKSVIVDNLDDFKIQIGNYLKKLKEYKEKKKKYELEADFT